jgi:hypothetical protein
MDIISSARIVISSLLKNNLYVNQTWYLTLNININIRKFILEGKGVKLFISSHGYRRRCGE